MTEEDKLRLICFVMCYASGEWADGPDTYGFNWKTHYPEAVAVLAFLSENPDFLKEPIARGDGFLRSKGIPKTAAEFLKRIDEQRPHCSWLQTDILGQPFPS